MCFLSLTQESTFFLLFCCWVVPSFAYAQSTTHNQDPNKCYVRCVKPPVYETFYDQFLTYTPKDTSLYPFETVILEVMPEKTRWESFYIDNCQSEDPNECYAVKYVIDQPKYDTIYQPIEDTLGSPYYREIELVELVEEGGFTSYQEVDCALTSYNVLPLRFRAGTDDLIVSDRSTSALEKLLDLLRDKPDIQVQIRAHTASPGAAEDNETLSQARANRVVNYLLDEGIEPWRLEAKGMGERQLKNKCIDGVPCSEVEHAVNRRIEFLVLNAEN